MTYKKDEFGRQALPRVIGTVGSTALVVGIAIGSGIFLVPHNVAEEVGSVRSLLLVWVLGGALALAGALSLAELGAAMPEAGGIYVYLREAYGKLPAFLFGWGMLLVIESGSLAALAVAFGIYSANLVPLSATGQKITGCIIIGVLTLVNIAGAREGAAVQTLFTVAKLAGLAAIMGFALYFHSAHHVFSSIPALPTPHTSLSSFGIALVGVLWAYNGWHALSFSAGEVKDPSRALPRSYLIGTLIIIAAYLGANLAYLRAMPLPVLAEYQRVASRAMQIFAGPAGATFVSVVILCSIFGALNGNLLSGPRAYFAMARDGLFFTSVGRVHPRFRTPVLAILIQGLWAMVLAVTGSYQQLYTYVIFSAWIFYAACIFAVLVLRRRAPLLRRPYHVWGYPVVPIAFVIAALAVVGNTMVREPRESAIGLALILIGIPIYFIWKKRASQPVA
ncbi:MAG: APC family permease [Terriglobia bacterium]